MSRLALVQPLHPASGVLDHEAWAAFLGERLVADGEWRDGEFDPDRWRFTGDCDNPMTTTTRCRVERCERMLEHRGLCSPCGRSLAASGLSHGAFLATHEPATSLPPSGARLARNEFSLASLPPTPRTELLFVLQQRDAFGLKINPSEVRRFVQMLDGLEALATTTLGELLTRAPKTPGVVSLTRFIVRVIGLAFEEFRGIRHFERDVWDGFALDLASPRLGRRPNTSHLDFTPLTERWLRDATKHWVVTLHPDATTMSRGLQAATMASQVLRRQPGGGEQPSELGFAAATAVYEAIK